jgi:hypothetical protein
VKIKLYKLSNNDTLQFKVGKVMTARESPGEKTWGFPGCAILPYLGNTQKWFLLFFKNFIVPIISLI